MPNADWVFRVGAGGKRAHYYRPFLQFYIPQIKSTQFPCSNKDLAKAYNTTYGEGLEPYQTFVRKTS